MKILTRTGFLFLASWGFLLSGLILASALAQPIRTKAMMGKDTPTVIRSNSLEIDNRKKVVSFVGEVEATKGDMVIRCSRMLIHYADKGENQAQGKQGFKIERIVATGGVRIDRTEGGYATAEEAVYTEDGETLVLKGNPIVKQGEDFVEGSVITLFLKEDRSVVEGAANRKARAVLSPKTVKR